MSNRKAPEDVAIRLCRRSANGPNGCVNWTGPIGKNGYGIINIGSRLDGSRKVVNAHRLSASVWLGFDLASPLLVCHKCDNKRCINPDHFFIGTDLDNRRDKENKGRGVHVVGELAAGSKLTYLEACGILTCCAEWMSQHEAARRYSIDNSTVCRIVNRKYWRHLCF